MAYDEAREKEMKKRGIKVLSEKVLPKMSSKVNAVSSKVEQATNARFEETLDDSENNDLVCEGPGDATIRYVFTSKSVFLHDSPFSTSSYHLIFYNIALAHSL